eukprot:gene7981-16333_t
MIRAIAEGGTFVGVVFLSRHFFPSQKWLKEKENQLHEQKVKLFDQSRSMIQEEKFLQKILDQRYQQVLSFALKKYDNSQNRKHVDISDYNEFTKGIMGDDMFPLELTSEEDNSSENKDEVVEEYRIVPIHKIDSIIQFTTPMEPSLIHIVLGTLAEKGDINDEIEGNFAIHENTIRTLLHNYLISDVIGPVDANLVTTFRLASAVVGYGLCSIMLNKAWPSPIPLSIKDLAKVKVLPMGRGLLLCTITAYIYALIKASYKDQHDEKREVQALSRQILNDFNTDSSTSSVGSDGSVEEEMFSIPKVWPGGTIQDPIHSRRVYSYVLDVPLLRQILVTGLLFPRLLAVSGPGVAYTLTTAATALLFSGNSDEDPQAASLDLDGTEDMLLEASFAMMCCAAYHTTGTLFVPILLHIFAHASVLLSEFQERNDIQVERMSVWPLLVCGGALISILEDGWLHMKHWARHKGILQPLPVVHDNASNPVPGLRKIAEQAVLAFRSDADTNTSSTTSGGGRSRGGPSSTLVQFDDVIDFMTSFMFALEGRVPGKISDQLAGDNARNHNSTSNSTVLDAVTELYTQQAELMKLSAMHASGGLKVIDAQYLLQLMELWLSTDDNEFLSKLNMDRLYRETFRFDGCSYATDEEAKDELLDLMQTYYTRMLEVDMNSASEVARIQGPHFITSLAGRSPRQEDFKPFYADAQLWRKVCVMRASVAFLADYGLTPHRFNVLITRASKHHDDVMKLQSDWVAYFQSTDHVRKWITLANPIKKIN